MNFSFKFLGIHISRDLKWATRTTTVVKKAQQRLYCLRRLRKFNVSPHMLRAFYNSTIESILTATATDHGKKRISLPNCSLFQDI